MNSGYHEKQIEPFFMPLIQEKIEQISFDNGSIRLSYSGTGEISNEELEDRSKTFARILKDSGCRAGEPVCCIMNKSIDFFITIWGIRYAGCTSIPIDPNQQANLIQSVILESGAEWVMVDRWAEPLLRTVSLGKSPLNLGWMDSTDMIPDNCLPEFVRDNIDHIPMRPVLSEPDEEQPVITFNIVNDGQLIKNTFTGSEINNFISPIFDIVGIDSGSKVAGLMSGCSPSFLLETMSLFWLGATVFLFDPFPQGFEEELIKEIDEQQITHLLLEAGAAEKFTEKNSLEITTRPRVQEVIIWDKISSEKKLSGLKEIFPDSKIYEICRDPDENLCIYANNSATRFTPIANIPTQNSKQISL